jgi:small subunit ribosomal protein S6
MLRQYESVIITTPVLTEDQTKEVTGKFRSLLENNNCEIVHEEKWGLKKLAYPIKKKNTGFYHLFEFKAAPDFIQKLEIEYKRDERVLRFLTVELDKHAVNYNERKRRGEVGKVFTTPVTKIDELEKSETEK